MAELGVPINVWQSRGVNSVTVKVSTTYRVPLRLSDAFYATSAVRGVSRSQVVLAEAVRRRADDAMVAVSCSFAVSGEVSEGGGRKGSFFSFFPPEEEEKTYTLLFSLSTSFPLSKRFLNKKKQFSEVICATVDNDFKVVRIPAEVRPALERGAARFAAGSEK